MITVRVCIGSACHKRGSYAVLKRMKELTALHEVADQVTFMPAFCLGECKNGISAKVDDVLITGISSDTVDLVFEKHILSKLSRG